jgi:ethanolamine ammonia-lyase small subunit
MNNIHKGDNPPPSGLIEAVRARTPARIFVGRAGAAYRTQTQITLRADHAAARDAVWAEVDLARDLGADLVAQRGLFEVCTRAATKEQYLLRPDLGRQLEDAARAALAEKCPRGVDLQVFVGDGLSAAAVAAQVPALLPLLLDRAAQAGWTVGRPFLVRHCRVGVLNDVGDLLAPSVAVLLIGERPGLATAESLSAYMAHAPRAGDTDARRNLISNIHARGVGVDEAARRILALAEHMRRQGASGVGVKEELPVRGGELLAQYQARQRETES